MVGKFDGDPAELLVVGVGDGADEPVVGSRWKLDDALASAAVYRTGLPARLDHPGGGADPDVAAIVERIRPVATVAVPIKVEGRLWGAMIISTLSEPLPADTDERLQSFTDLIATALANAEARGEVERLAEEQAALRRVAVLVAQQPSPSEVFTAVTQAVGLLLDADLAVLHVFPGDGTATTIASWSGDGPMLPIGTRFPLDGDSLAARIFETGAPARMHSYDEAEGEAADLARSLGVRSAVGAPILVEGKLWGALMAATRGVEPWAENAETRIAAFTELVATAIANAEARDALAELAEEQAALRRVATLVAQGASPQDLFEAVAEEVGRLLPSEAPRWAASNRTAALPRWPRGAPHEAASLPAGGGRPRARTSPGWCSRRAKPLVIDDFSAATDPIGVAAREAGIKSAVGSPIVVEGQLWGVMTATSTEGPLPPDTEARLASFTELVATAIANAESSAEIAASRRRIVAASDDARRRIVRDLHDGAQQRLVHTVITLKLAQQALAKGAENGPLLMQEAIEQRGAGDGRGARARPRDPAFGPHARRPARGRRGAGLADAGAGAGRRSPPTACPRRSRRPRTSSSPKRSPTSPSTPAPRAPRSPRGSRTERCWSRCATTASAAPAATAAASKGSGTASPRSTGASGSRAPPTAGRWSRRPSPSRQAPPSDRRH